MGRDGTNRADGTDRTHVSHQSHSSHKSHSSPHYYFTGTLPSKYLQFLINAIKSAISSLGIVFSSPSGMRERPVDLSCSISPRATVMTLAPACLSVMEVLVSAVRIPAAAVPSARSKL